MYILALSAFLFVLFSPQNAHAYLDPGTGSYLLQILLAGLLGLTFTVKAFWRQIKTFFANMFSRRGVKDDGDR